MVTNAMTLDLPSLAREIAEKFARLENPDDPQLDAYGDLQALIAAGLSAALKAQQEQRCYGELQEAGEVVCKCASGKNGVCGYQDLEMPLGNLLARIHGDGGHRQSEVGPAKACEEAEKQVIELMREKQEWIARFNVAVDRAHIHDVERLEADVLALTTERDQIAENCNRLNDQVNALTTALAEAKQELGVLLTERKPTA